MRIKRNLFAGLFLILGLNIASAQVKLSFNPEKGKKYEYQTEVIQNIKQNLMGQEIPMEMTTSMTCLMEIKDKTPQEIQVQLTYQDLAYVVSSPMMKMEYDSKNPVENPTEIDKVLERAFSNFMGKSFLVVIAPDGSVKSVTTVETVAESAANTSAANWQVDAQIAAQINQQFSGDAMKNMFEQSFKMYPANAVTAGDSWNIEGTTTINNMNTSLKTKYTLKEVSRNMATISVESDVEMESGAGLEGKLAGIQTGMMTIDTETGLPVTGDISSNFAGILKTQGMDVQMEITTKAKTSTKEVN